MRKPKIYTTNTTNTNGEAKEIYGTSIKDVKDFIETNKEILGIEISGKLIVETTSCDYKINIEFQNEDNFAIHSVKNIKITNALLNITDRRIFHTYNAELFLVNENNNRLEKLKLNLAK